VPEGVGKAGHLGNWKSPQVSYNRQKRLKTLMNRQYNRSEGKQYPAYVMNSRAKSSGENLATNSSS
jgi:hypothetical protein